MRLKGAFREYWKKESKGAANPRQHAKEIDLFVPSLTATSIEMIYRMKSTRENLTKLNIPVRSHHEITIFQTLL